MASPTDSGPGPGETKLAEVGEATLDADFGTDRSDRPLTIDPRLLGLIVITMTLAVVIAGSALSSEDSTNLACETIRLSFLHRTTGPRGELTPGG